MDTQTSRTIAAVVLSLGIWYGWLLLFPPPEPTEAAEGVSDSDAAADTLGSDAVADAEAPATPGAVAEPARGPSQIVELELCRTSVEVDTSDGRVRDAILLDHKAPYDIEPLYMWVWSLFDGPWKPYGEEPDQEHLLTDKGRGWIAGAGEIADVVQVEVLEQTDHRIVTRGVTSRGLEVVRTLREADVDGACAWEIEATWTNRGTAPATDLWVSVSDRLPESTSRYSPTMRPRALVDGSLEYEDDLDSLATYGEMDGEVAWFGLSDGYFALLAVPQKEAGEGSAFFTIHPDFVTGERSDGVYYQLDASVPPGGSLTERFLVYAGPKQSDALAAVDPRLADAVELGFLSFLAWPLLWLLRAVYSVVGNWGLAIIGLTFLVKALFFPLTQRAFKSSQSMQAISPLMQEIRETYKDDPEEMNRRTIALFQEHGVNPLGGCLPMIVQMPVWFALYSVLLSAVELYHTEFLFLKDLSKPDPTMGLPLFVIGLMVAQQSFVPMGNMDPAQARLMKLMPLVFGIFFFTFPAGLVLYIFVNITLSILQQWYIRRTFGSTTPAAAEGGATETP